jgi:hypothetical protein
VQAFPTVAKAVVGSLIGTGDESVEGNGHVENGCGHGVCGTYVACFGSAVAVAYSGRPRP